MNYLRILHVPALVALCVIAAACGQQSNMPSARLQASTATATATATATGGPKSDAGFVQARDTRAVGERLDVYIGEVFAAEQKALSVKDAQADAPSF